MDKAERLARATRLREAAMADVREMNEQMARAAARACCDQCPHPKPERNEESVLPNGVRLSVHAAHCRQPAPDCTARVYSHLESEVPEVANRMVEHLAAVPDLAAAGVTWMACLAPEADRFILTYCVPESGRVAAAVGSMPVEAFR